VLQNTFLEIGGVRMLIRADKGRLLLGVWPGSGQGRAQHPRLLSR